MDSVEFPVFVILIVVVSSNTDIAAIMKRTDLYRTGNFVVMIIKEEGIQKQHVMNFAMEIIHTDTAVQRRNIDILVFITRNFVVILHSVEWDPVEFVIFIAVEIIHIEIVTIGIVIIMESIMMECIAMDIFTGMKH